MTTTATESADVVIVGGGIEGTAAAWALARHGITDVVVCERNTVGSGGTGKSSGIARCHYGVPSLAAMAWKSLPVLEEAEEILGVDVGFRRTGYVVGVGQRDVDSLRANLAAQRRLGIDTESIDRAEVAKLWPSADLTDFAAFGWEPRGGHGDAYRTAQGFSAAARRYGVRIRQGSAVSEILTSSGRARGVRLAGGETIASGSVVVAAGPWSVSLLSPLGIELPITVHREQLILIRPGAGADLAGAPVFSDLVSLQYIRPEPTGELLVGNSDLGTLEPADPDRYSDRADPGFLESAVGKVALRLPGLPDPALASSYAGCYDVTPDFNPVISRTEVDGLVVAAGFSGHGFKISPAVGELVAELVHRGDSTDPAVPAADFRLERFGEGAPLTSPHPYVGAGQLR
ncbi:glycine/D-amino acid oxidase-like deaminating enzyme [Saccharomonospora amisosensis]|uniref:Glycine/D-amino acid oxidase-like deaminating enzyme n=1 Tax=Saccharomonospora amisosensis TaxID=1128677 RepID=A0A7X5URR3_9PSEU|nr:FAD-binding oxidoreductase [Saccharomonospora amisosensis]NIJ12945.1 glycine/D-amino acid oxidase-like deaminating enzyme [Saccharomonospora amisosensis]